jgi:hypothetical protein
MEKKTNKGKKYLTKITAKQQKFIDLYTSKYGELSATDCAIKAGYDRESAHTRASELLDWRKNPEIVSIINRRQVGNKEVWLLDKTMHLANLTRIQQEARAKGLNLTEYSKEILGAVLDFINNNFSPQQSKPSMVSNYFYVNISYLNEEALNSLQELGLDPLQISLRLEK